MILGNSVADILHYTATQFATPVVSLIMNSGVSNPFAFSCKLLNTKNYYDDGHLTCIFQYIQVILCLCGHCFGVMELDTGDVVATTEGFLL